MIGEHRKIAEEHRIIIRERSKLIEGCSKIIAERGKMAERPGKLLEKLGNSVHLRSKEPSQTGQWYIQFGGARLLPNWLARMLVPPNS